MDEIYKPIVGWEGFYDISNHGRVRSLYRTVPNGKGSMKRIFGRILKPSAGTKELPYAIVTLQRGGARDNPNADIKMPYVHTLVLEHFIGPRPDGMEACHNDGNGMNNHVDNLRWDTHHENMLDQIRHGRPVRAKSGYAGVYKLPNGKYRASFVYKQKLYYTGASFLTALEASDARDIHRSQIVGV